MDKNPLIEALRKAENEKFGSIPPENSLDHEFSSGFRKKMKRLMFVQRFFGGVLAQSPARRAVVMLVVLLLTFGVRPDRNPLFRFAQSVPSVRTAGSAPASEPQTADPDPVDRLSAENSHSAASAGRAVGARAVPPQLPAEPASEAPSAAVLPSEAPTASEASKEPVHTAAPEPLTARFDTVRSDASSQTGYGESTAAEPEEPVAEPPEAVPVNEASPVPTEPEVPPEESAGDLSEPVPEPADPPAPQEPDAEEPVYLEPPSFPNVTVPARAPYYASAPSVPDPPTRSYGAEPCVPGVWQDKYVDMDPIVISPDVTVRH